MLTASEILKEILALDMEETATFQLTPTRYLFVDNWQALEDDEDEKFTSLELNEGFDDAGCYVFTEILECGTYTFKDKKGIESGIDYMLSFLKEGV